MRRKRLLWQLFPTYLTLIFLTIIAVTWYDVRSLQIFYVQHTAADLQHQALLIEPQIAHLLRDGQIPEVDRVCKTLGKGHPTRITVMLPDGRVAGDSQEPPAKMENHRNRAEVQTAFSGRIGQAIRYSATQRQRRMYIAIPIYDHERLLGVLRTSLPILTIGQPLHRLDFQLLFAGLLFTGLAAIASFLVTRRISRPLEEMRHGAERFARGDLKQKLAVPDSVEIGSLAEAMNEMALQLDERFNTILQHRNEQDAILSSMIEGVMAVDLAERIISLNQAAARMLRVDVNLVVGRLMQETLRNTELYHFIRQTLTGDQPVEGEIVLRDAGQRFLQLHGAVLRDAKGQAIGAVIVLNDITRLRRLENMRKEFVANVSHELRTPITSIKGFVEALIDGALDQREDAEHFLQVINKQVDRLDVIIDDLLQLSTIEQGVEHATIALETGRINDVIQTAVQVCCAKAAEKQIALRISADEQVAARINPPLLEQAVVNLIDNAIKYSQHGSTIEVDAVVKDPDEIIIRVADHGCGIDQEHLPRLFERFYRVDKARSRKLGGTGLGLAIVKHIAQAHGGHVSVSSTPGRGSTFLIHLPIPIDATPE